jgi:hypothetical protein
MTRRLVGAVVAAAFGFLGGAAGTSVAHDNTTNRDVMATMTEHMPDVDMDTMMSASMGSMMSGSMMGPGSSLGPGMSDPPASSMPGSQHELHHPAASQDVVR